MDTKVLLDRIAALESRLDTALTRTDDRHVQLARAIATDIRHLVERADRQGNR